MPDLRRHAPAARSALRARRRRDGARQGDLRDQRDAAARHARAVSRRSRCEGAKREIADKIVKEIVARLAFLNNVGLDYLSLERSAETLSGGEAQRIRLASQIGSGLTGVMYVLDEPSIGLHQRDNDRLIDTLKHLRDLGNSVIVVEHDEDMIRAADYVVDMGPGAGVHGGHVIAAGHAGRHRGEREVADRPVPVAARARSSAGASATKPDGAACCGSRRAPATT